MKKRKLVALVVCSLCIIGAAVTYVQLNSAANGTLTKVAIKDDTQPQIDDRIEIENDYASFSYPTKFTANPVDPPLEPIVASYSFTKQQIGSWQIGVQVTKLETGALSDDSTYNFRNVTPARFSKEKQKVGEHTVTVFTDTSDTTFAKTAYLHRANLSASVTMMGGTAGNYSQLQSDFDALIASWQWR